MRPPSTTLRSLSLTSGLLPTPNICGSLTLAKISQGETSYTRTLSEIWLTLKERNNQNGEDHAK